MLPLPAASLLVRRSRRRADYVSASYAVLAARCSQGLSAALASLRAGWAGGTFQKAGVPCTCSAKQYERSWAD